MAGQYSFGQIYSNAGSGRFRDCKSFGEGVQYRASDTLLNAPKTDNPHASGTPAALAWNLGWDLAEANTGGNISKADLGSVAPVGIIPA